MSWSSTAPSGVTWGSPVTGATVRYSNYSTTLTVSAARGTGNTYYIRVSAAYGTGDGGAWNPPTLYLRCNSESVNVGTVSRYSPTVRYYTGSSASAGSVTVYGSQYDSYAPSGSPSATVSIPAVTSYAVTYNGNGATGGSTAAQTKVSGTDLTLRSNGFTREGYVFVEWNTAADGTGTSYAEGAAYTANAALALYAIWKKGNLPLYVNEGGTIRQVEKVYVNVDGAIREAKPYVNVGGVIYEIS